MLTEQYSDIANRVRKAWWVGPWLKAEAAVVIDLLANAVEKLMKQKRDLIAENDRQLRDAEASANWKVHQSKQVTARIDTALAEMRKGKGNSKREQPVAILLSPYQAQELRLLGNNLKRTKNSEDALVHTYMGYPLYVCSGVYGPVVVTEDALAALTRQAPELQMRAL